MHRVGLLGLLSLSTRTPVSTCGVCSEEVFAVDDVTFGKGRVVCIESRSVLLGGFLENYLAFTRCNFRAHCACYAFSVPATC